MKNIVLNQVSFEMLTYTSFNGSQPSCILKSANLRNKITHMAYIQLRLKHSLGMAQVFLKVPLALGAIQVFPDPIKLI